MTPAECRDAVVAWLLTFPPTEWVPIADIVTKLKSMGVTAGQGKGDLFWLVDEGRVEKRESATKVNGWGRPASEYRAVRSQHDLTGSEIDSIVGAVDGAKQ